MPQFILFLCLTYTSPPLLISFPISNLTYILLPPLIFEEYNSDPQIKEKKYSCLFLCYCFFFFKLCFSITRIYSIRPITDLSYSCPSFYFHITILILVVKHLTERTLCCSTFCSHPPEHFKNKNSL